MDTWAVRAAAHATLTSGIGTSGFPVRGSASLDGFALGVAMAGLAFAAVNSSWKPRWPRWPPDVWPSTVRWARGHQQRQRLTRAPLAGAMAQADGGILGDGGMA